MKNIVVSACIIALVCTNAMPLYAHSNATNTYDEILRNSALITSVQIQSNLQSLKEKDFLTSVNLDDIKRDIDWLNQINTTLQLNSLESHHSDNPCSNSIFADNLNDY